MKKYSCLILDDNVFFQKILEELIGNSEDLGLSGTYQSKEQFLNNSKLSADVIFFDPSFIGMNATTLINQFSNDPLLVIISSSDQDASEVFQNNVIDLLDKSTLTVDRFEQTVDKIKSTSLATSISA